MQTTSNMETTESYIMTSDSIANYIQYEISRGASKDSIRAFRRAVNSLFQWLPEEKLITKDLLLAWRQGLKDHGYTQQTELSYVKGINRYLDYIGCSDIRFNRARPKDIAGKQFGYLLAIEPTGEKYRKDYIWRCQCKCGKKVEYPATRLLTGNTTSCGCVRAENLKIHNKYIDGTSLRQSMEEKVFSNNARSGYTGVTMKSGKWKAYIRYKGENITLGYYTNLEDAVKARARGKELVQMDAMGLLDFYEELHKSDPERPNRAEIKEENRQLKQEKSVSPILPATRGDNASGYPGVSRKRNKWAAKITYQKTTYQLGSYESIEDAVKVRKNAEKILQETPDSISVWAQGVRQSARK